jgi:tetratricopeptide (TPR) repeat protein
MKKIIMIGVLFFSICLFGQQKNALYYNKEGWRFLEQRDSVQALGSFKAAVAQNGDYKEALTGLGYTYLLRGGEREAYSIFKNLEKKYPDDVQVLNGLGHSLSALFRFQEALDVYERVNTLDLDNIDALYGTALVYHRMGKKVMAERTIEKIFRLNPYHYDTLLLAGKIKYGDGRIGEAEKFIKKAIGVRQEYPEGYVEYAKLLLLRYRTSGSRSFLSDANEELLRGVTIDPDSPEPYKMLGIIKLIDNDPSSAQEYFEKAQLIDPTNYSVVYNLALACELLGDIPGSEKYFSSVLKDYPDDAMTLARFEQFLVDQDFAFGNPKRAELAKYHRRQYVVNASKNLSDFAMLHLRISTLLDPSNTSVLNGIADYYKANGYNRFYVDELKHILRVDSSSKNREKLNVAVIQRRDALYNREGYGMETPPRNANRVLVLPFTAGSEPYVYYDAGEVFAKMLSFSLKQFGKMEVIEGSERKEFVSRLGGSLDSAQAMRLLTDADIDYLVTGDFDYRMESVTAEYTVSDFSTGGVLYKTSLYENGKDSINRINFRGASQIFDNMPVKGVILKLDQTGAIVNVGSYDGIKKDDFLYAEDRFPGKEKSRRIILKVSETDTLLSRAEFLNPEDFNRVSENGVIHYLERKKASIIE